MFVVHACVQDDDTPAMFTNRVLEDNSLDDSVQSINKLVMDILRVRAFLCIV